MYLSKNISTRTLLLCEKNCGRFCRMFRQCDLSLSWRWIFQNLLKIPHLKIYINCIPSFSASNRWVLAYVYWVNFYPILFKVRFPSTYMVTNILIWIKEVFTLTTIFLLPWVKKFNLRNTLIQLGILVDVFYLLNQCTLTLIYACRKGFKGIYNL